MHPIIHFIVSLVIGVALTIHSKRRYVIVVLGALLVNGFIDSDLLLIKAGIFSQRYFATGIAMLYAPMIILLGAHLYERGSGRSTLTRISLLIVLIGASHLLLDTFSAEPVYLYYPFSMTLYSINRTILPYALLIFGVLVFIVNLIETHIYSLHEGGEKILEDEELKKLVLNYRSRMDYINGGKEEKGWGLFDRP